MPWTTDEIHDLLLNSQLACMRAICAIFRNQTDYEKSCRATVNKNGKGFRANHAKAGSDLALWMTEGNADGVMRRKIGGFATYDGNSIRRADLCYVIAKQYLEQLAVEANCREAAMVKAHEDEEYGRYERQDAQYRREMSNDYHIYDTAPC